jgi:predicted enzyme related to lactoylglutathione lyase
MMVDLLINIDVDDLHRAIDFYTSAFDLRTGRRFGTDAVELLGASAPIYLLVKAAGTESSSHSGQIRDYARHWTSVHLDIVVENIDVAVSRATACGAVLERAAETSSWGKLALLADPFGNGFCLVEFVGRGYDEIASL